MTCMEIKSEISTSQYIKYKVVRKNVLNITVCLQKKKKT